MAANLMGDGNVYNPMSASIPNGLPADVVSQIQDQSVFLFLRFVRTDRAPF